MRAPFQILVILFRRTPGGPEFAVLKRSDTHYWQFVAGGGEDEETPIQAAERETQKEVAVSGEMMRLDSLSTVPKECLPQPIPGVKMSLSSLSIASPLMSALVIFPCHKSILNVDGFRTRRLAACSNGKAIETRSGS